MGVTLGNLIEQLEKKADELGICIYNICKRKGGWGIEWFEEKRIRYVDEPLDRPSMPLPRSFPPPDDWQRGIVNYSYYPTLRDAIKGELERVKWGKNMDLK